MTAPRTPQAVGTPHPRGRSLQNQHGFRHHFSPPAFSRPSCFHNDCFVFNMKATRQRLSGDWVNYPPVGLGHLSCPSPSPSIWNFRKCYFRGARKPTGGNPPPKTTVFCRLSSPARFTVTHSQLIGGNTTERPSLCCLPSARDVGRPWLLPSRTAGASAAQAPSHRPRCDGEEGDAARSHVRRCVHHCARHLPPTAGGMRPPPTQTAPPAGWRGSCPW